MPEKITEDELQGFRKDPDKVREVGRLEDENDFTAGPWSPGYQIPSNPKKPKS